MPEIGLVKDGYICFGIIFLNRLEVVGRKIGNADMISDPSIIMRDG